MNLNERFTKICEYIQMLIAFAIVFTSLLITENPLIVIFQFFGYAIIYIYLEKVK